MKVCNGPDEAVLKARRRAIASDPSVDRGSLPRWPALTTMILRNAVQTTTLGVFVEFSGLPIGRAEESVPPSNTKLKRLLAEAMLDNAALKDLPVPAVQAGDQR
ncbi:hypothetical protein [Rhizobium sp. 007]|uniref:hypothetical protein n=1 Tax=Rhizobium sp. 007 TaxID=2785056 RepID=UPI001FED66DA|nr:hypothetical protein [Rhizobium sp. 007]